MSAKLPPSLLKLPVAHRALHDVAQGRPENSRAAIRAAIDAGYAIEIDLQLSSDGHAMVFHDDDLDRLTGQTGPVRARSHAELQSIQLTGGDGEGIPDLAEVLALVDGRVPLLIEVKDQHGQMGPTDGRLEQATFTDLCNYQGDFALMSFNPQSAAQLAQMMPDVACGIVTSAYTPEGWPELTPEICARLREIPDLGPSGASFISHEAADLDRPLVQKIRAQGMPVLCWTIRSAKQETAARKLADNVTFEGYLSPHPA